MLFFNKVAGLRFCEQTPKFISCADIVIFQKHIFQIYFKIFIAHDSLILGHFEYISSVLLLPVKARTSEQSNIYNIRRLIQRNEIDT